MIATDMTTGGSVEERLRWAFKMFDKDGSGRIEKFEMEEIISILYELNGEPLVRIKTKFKNILSSIFQFKAKISAESLFLKLDKDKTGELDEEQFISGCMKDPGIMFALSNQTDTVP